MQNEQISHKPAGTIVSVGVIPGAIILSNNFGEVMAIDVSIVSEVIACMQRMTLFSKKHDTKADEFKIIQSDADPKILARNWPKYDRGN